MKTLLKRMTMPGWLSLAGMIIVLVIALLAPLIAPNNPMDTSPERILKELDGYPMGCDQMGQCFLSRLIYGARLSLLIGFASRFAALIIGLSVGMCAGYFGGKIDWLLMRVVDMFLAFPSLLLSIAVSMAMGSGMGTVVFAIAIVGWAEMARIIRAATLELRSAEYVVAARTLGASHLRIILTHILPNCLPLITVIFTMGIATAVLSEASLSFLGLGLVGEPSWGQMLDQAVKSSSFNWWMAAFPGGAIFLTVFAYNLIGEAFRDAIDPKLSRSAGVGS